MKFVHELSVNSSARAIWNTLAGGDLTWTVGGRYAPVAGLTFRGAFTRAVRAPSVTEAFNPRSGGFFSDNNAPANFYSINRINEVAFVNMSVSYDITKMITLRASVKSGWPERRFVTPFCDWTPGCTQPAARTRGWGAAVCWRPTSPISRQNTGLGGGRVLAANKPNQPPEHGVGGRP